MERKTYIELQLPDVSQTNDKLNRVIRAQQELEEAIRQLAMSNCTMRMVVKTESGIEEPASEG